MAETFKLGNNKWAVKEGSLLSYNDENNNFKPLPFTFTRDSGATYVDSDGLIKVASNGWPRIDYLDNPSGHLLLEPSRTNEFSLSENFESDIEWPRLNVTKSANQIIAPDNELTAYKLTETADTGVHALYKGISFTSGNSYSFSCFAKKGTSKYFAIFAGNPLTIPITSIYDLEDGVVVSSNASSSSKIEYYGNGWYRCIVSASAAASASTSTLFGLSNGTTTNYAGSTSNDLYIWGVQYEEGSYATSYIPTNGTTETRVAETCTGAGNAQVFNDSEGVLFLNLAALANDGTGRGISINDGTTNNRVIFAYTNVPNQISGFVQDFTSSIIHTITNATEFNKIAFKYKTGDTALWANSVEVVTTTQAFSQSGLKEIKFDNAIGSNPFYGKIKQIGVYDTALTDEELEQLTS